MFSNSFHMSCQYRIEIRLGSSMRQTSVGVVVTSNATRDDKTSNVGVRHRGCFHYL
jgi:hypothetical protein